ncbi:uncharacterized protein LOC126841327 [Adelges cooleyi]|uniref:uncharacterized protein LOC126841327 n=1 Tax=Adelges cooleyi TaxID=133065 RepID=UPI00217F488A|nr:uncharacterized protein LOC126841327 [Adelges cooleyi]
MEEERTTEVENSGKSVTVQCVQYLVSYHLKSKCSIKKDELMKTVFKGRVTGKNYERVMEDVSLTLKNVFGLSISYIKDDCKQFIIVNDIEDFTSNGENNFDLIKYRILLKPVVAALVMLLAPISEGQMWNILERFASAFDLEMNQIKKVVKGDFVKDHYLHYKATDDTTVMLDPEKTSYWFTLGTRALVEFDQNTVLQRVGELYNIPPKSFKRVYTTLNK